MTHATLLHQSAGGGGLVRNGLVAEYRFDECRNLLKYSQQFDNAAWTKADCAITANSVAAPDGTTTADTVTLTVGAAQSLVQAVTVTAATVYTFSIWVKLGTAAALKYAIYDASNSADIVAATSYGATSEWARYTVSFTTPAGCTSVSIRPVKDSAQDNRETAYIWGAQLEAGTAARTYVPTKDKQLLMDYSRPRKNLLLPNQANCCENGTVPFTKATAGDAVTAEPTGTTAAWQGSYSAKVDTANAAASEGLYTTDIIYGLKPSTSYTASAYIKGAAGGETVKLRLRETTDAGVPVGTTLSDALTLTTAYQRVTVSRTFGTTGRGARLLVLTPTQQNSVFYIDGLQLEEGSSATAWEAPPNIGILGSSTGSDTNDPTYTGTGASLTTDDCIILPKECFEVPAFSIEGVFTLASLATELSAAERIFSKSSEPGDATNRGVAVYIYYGETVGNRDKIRFSVFNSSGTQSDVISNDTLSKNTWYHVVCTYSGTSMKMYINNVLQSDVDAAAVTVAHNAESAQIGRYYSGGGSAYLSGTVTTLNFYNRALSQAEITRNYNYLKGYLRANRGIALA